MNIVTLFRGTKAPTLRARLAYIFDAFKMTGEMPAGSTLRTASGYLTPLQSYDLTTLSVGRNPGAAAPLGQILGGSSDIDGTGRPDVQHLYYVGQNKHIFEMAWGQSQGWRWYDLTEEIQIQGLLCDSWPHCYYSIKDAGGGAIEKTQHVIYRSGSLIHELWWLPFRWSHVRISNLASAPDAQGNPWGFSANYNRLVHQCIVYRGTNNHIHAIEWREDKRRTPRGSSSSGMDGGGDDCSAASVDSSGSSRWFMSSTEIRMA